MTRQQELKQLRAENAQLKKQVADLTRRLDHFIRIYFGSRSEKIDPAQLELLLGEFSEPTSPEEEDEPEPGLALLEEPPRASRKKPRPRKDRFPDNLPVTETVLTPPEVEADPESYRKIGEEVSVQYDYQPGYIKELRTIRPRFVKREDKALPPIIAPLPARLLERGILAPGFLAHIVVNKYAWHLPLYRQQQQLRREQGAYLSRNTLCSAVELVADWLRPVVDEMARQQFASGYVQMDETFIKYLDPGAGKARQGYLWVIHTPGGDTVYRWSNSRSCASLKTLVPSSALKGPKPELTLTLQGDGYSAYGSFSRDHLGVTLAGCWTHVRRYFREALEGRDAPLRSGWVLRQIAHLYRIESALQESRAGPALREARRASESRPIIERLSRALNKFKESGHHPPQTLFGKALNYALNQWPTLAVFLSDGRVELSNNLIENRIRPTAVGKKNYLFFGADGAGWRSAVLYSIITTCHDYGIDPYLYIKDVLQRLPEMSTSEIPSIVPKAWAGLERPELKSAS